MSRIRHEELPFFAVAALAFMASAAATISGYRAMSTMPGMEMPGGWTMSMTWMRMPGQSLSGAAAAFLGMWTVMMIAMMLPAVTPALVRYRRDIRPFTASRLDRCTAIVAVAYFTVWTMIGIAAFPLGVVLAELTMNLPALSRLVPAAAAIIIVVAGVLQFTSWKSEQLRCCRCLPAGSPAHARAAWQHGIRLGMSCVRCCAGLTAILLVVGIMNLHAMAIVTIAIAAERVAPASQRVVRAIGVIAIAVGIIQLSRI